MNNPLKNLFDNRSASNDFLLGKPATVADHAAESETQPQLAETLTRVFPDLFTGPEFVARALENLQAAAAFQVCVIRIDRTGAGAPRETPPETMLPALARTLDNFCENRIWQWSILDQDNFGCFLPLPDQTTSASRGPELQAALEALQPATFSIGCARYPLIDYQREDMLDNAFKALDHAAFFGPGSVVDFDAVSLNISGDRFYQKGDLNRAMDEFNRALVLDPENVNVHNSLGVCYGVLGAYEKAVKVFQTAADLAPQDLMPVYNIGLAHLLIGDKAAALESFLTAAEKDPQAFEPAFQTGRVYFENGKTKKARAYLEKATALNAESASAQRYMGLCYLELKKDAAAVVALKKAVQLNPNDAQALSALGYLLDRQGENLDVTTIFCQQSVEIAPENGLFRYRLGHLLAKRGALEEALREFETAQQLGHDVGQMIATVKERIAIEIN